MNNLPSVNDINIDSKIIEVLTTGNLKNLTNDQKRQYYEAVCKSLGLNHLTKPFAYYEMQGREVLGINKGGCEQLRKIYSISVVALESRRDGDTYIVLCKVQTPDGRIDQGTAAVDLKGLSGQALANAIMKAETKAKNRATQSICSLGMLDYTELEDIRARKSDGAKALNAALATNGNHEPLPNTEHRYDLDQVPAERRQQAIHYAESNGAWKTGNGYWISPTMLERLNKYELISDGEYSQDLTEG